MLGRRGGSVGLICQPRSTDRRKSGGQDALAHRARPHWTHASVHLQFPFDDVRHPQNKIKKMKSSTQDKAEGTAKNISGTIKEATGKAVGNDRLQADGKAEKVQGQVQKKVGEIKGVLGS